MTEFLGMHGVVRDPVIDANGRAVYCRDECACSHCNAYSNLLREARHSCDVLHACVVLMFVLGLMGIALALVAGRALA